MFICNLEISHLQLGIFILRVLEWPLLASLQSRIFDLHLRHVILSSQRYT
jgi:hypothetical protein